MNPKPSIKLLDGGNLSIHVPMTLKKAHGRKLIIAPESVDGTIADAGAFHSKTNRSPRAFKSLLINESPIFYYEN